MGDASTVSFSLSNMLKSTELSNLAWIYAVYHEAPIAIGQMYLSIAAWIILFLVCYFVKIESQESLKRWGIYTCFMSYAILFVLCMSHPYWLLIMMPFMAIMMAQNAKYLYVNMIVEMLLTWGMIFAQIFKFPWCFGNALVNGMFLPLLLGKQSTFQSVTRQDSLSVRMASYETSVQDVVKQIMKESDNLNAEAMLCRLGVQSSGKKRVSAEDGLSAIRMLIKEMGYNPDRYNLADGCGLSNYNYISPELLVSFLRYAYSRTDVFRKLYKALPIGGVDGTLEFRMKKGTLSHRNVHAKTGSFTAINCLAGYLKARNGHEIAFAIMNQNALSGREARAFQDAVCDEVIR